LTFYFRTNLRRLLKRLPVALLAVFLFQSNFLVPTCQPKVKQEGRFGGALKKRTPV
jgi:hypothetical protein